MTATQSNIATVKSIYDAFGRGDVPAIIERMAPDVSWEEGAPAHPIPWLTPGEGRQAVVRFFETLRQMQFHSFEVVAVMGEGDRVVGLVRLDATWTPSGRRFQETSEAHIWRFDDRGRIVGFRHAADTLTHFAAACGSPA